MIYNDLEQMIGNTPLFRLSKIEKEHGLKAHLYAKIESVNPSGSIKARAALEMLNDAEEQGRLKQGGTVIEPTSGNTGIALAALCTTKGYRCVIVMPDSMSLERRKLMTAYGAELVLTEGAKGMAGAIEKAEEIQKSTPNSIIMGQFDNKANAKAHYKTTGPEIFADLEGKVDAFVASVGTGGTLTGTATYLKEQNKNIYIVAVEPKSSNLLTGGKAGGHKIQGIGANFIPSVLDTKIYDEVMDITNEDAYQMGVEMGKKEGILVGISSGANLQATIELAKRPEFAGKNIVTVFPDSGDHYLSTEGYY